MKKRYVSSKRTKPLLKPHMPIYDQNAPPERIAKGMERYHWAMAKWQRKQKKADGVK
jgi:hypothetical protein